MRPDYTEDILQVIGGLILSAPRPRDCLLDPIGLLDSLNLGLSPDGMIHSGKAPPSFQSLPSEALDDALLLIVALILLGAKSDLLVQLLKSHRPNDAPGDICVEVLLNFLSNQARGTETLNEDPTYPPERLIKAFLNDKNVNESEREKLSEAPISPEPLLIKVVVSILPSMPQPSRIALVDRLIDICDFLAASSLTDTDDREDTPPIQNSQRFAQLSLMLMQHSFDNAFMDESRFQRVLKNQRALTWSGRPLKDDPRPKKVLFHTPYLNTLAITFDRYFEASSDDWTPTWASFVWSAAWQALEIRRDIFRAFRKIIDAEGLSERDHESFFDILPIIAGGHVRGLSRMHEAFVQVPHHLRSPYWNSWAGAATSRPGEEGGGLENELRWASELTDLFQSETPAHDDIKAKLNDAQPYFGDES